MNENYSERPDDVEQSSPQSHGRASRAFVIKATSSRRYVQRSGDCFYRTRRNVIICGFGAFKIKYQPRGSRLCGETLSSAARGGVGKPFDIPTTRAIMRCRCALAHRVFQRWWKLAIN